MSELNVAKLRADFPILTKRRNGKGLVYLDSAASSLKPWPVIERIGHFYSYETANVHRGAHFLSDQATGQYEAARGKIANFINCQANEIIFTSGTTESINLVASSFGQSQVQAGDEVLVTCMEHHSNIVPWQLLCQKQSAKLQVIKLTADGQLDYQHLESLLSTKTKILAISHASNVLGTINDVKRVCRLAHAKGAKVLVDGAQMAPSHKIDLQDLDADFYVFSGHKMFGPTGIGVLFGKHQLLEAMPPYQSGGSMIEHVSFEKTSFNELPFKFEAGTPHIEGAIGLGAAVEYLEKLGMDAIAALEDQMVSKAYSELAEIPGLKIFGPAKGRAPLLSFTIEGTHPSDLAQILDQENIAVRAGHLCAEPLLASLGVKSLLRASFSIFNNDADLQALVAGLKKAKEMLT